jgi:hypothetical protein
LRYFIKLTLQRAIRIPPTRIKPRTNVNVMKPKLALKRVKVKSVKVIRLALVRLVKAPIPLPVARSTSMLSTTDFPATF